MPNFSIQAVVLCDDVRREITNKDILIGVYGGGILVPTFPITIPISIWVELIPQESGNFEIELQVSLPGNQVKLRVRLQLNIPTTGEPTAFYTPQASCYVGEPGNIEVSVKSPNEEEWQIVKIKHISLGVATVPALPEIRISAPAVTNHDEMTTASPPPSEQSLSDAPVPKPSRARRRPLSRRTGRTPEPE